MNKTNNSPQTTLTPMMRQYLQKKEEIPENTLLLFRMGDFYEMFFDDAVDGSRLMDITLTKRSGIPMCGIPYHALNNYLPKVLETGAKVAIAEQMEDPKLAKGIVKREIIQVITPGTILDSNVLVTGKSNFIVSICELRKKTGIASLDISTGEFRVTECSSQDEVEMEINKLNPAECLIPLSTEKAYSKSIMTAGPRKTVWTALDDWIYDFENCKDTLKKHFAVASLDGFGCRGMQAGIAAAGSVFYYARNNMRKNANHITQLTTYTSSEYMLIDKISQRNLELVESIFADSADSTLLSVLDSTSTPMGKRMMREWILRPLLEPKQINLRLDAIEALIADQILLLELQESMASIKDLERTITRLNVGNPNARDFIVLEKGLSSIPSIKEILSMLDVEFISDLNKNLFSLSSLTQLIQTAIVDEPPLAIKDGGFIKEGYNTALDELKGATTEGKKWIAELQLKEQEATSIKNLKIRYNRVFGYYIEVTNSNKHMAPDRYIRKQTLTNAERFITPELKEIESKILGAEEKSKALEYELFHQIREIIVQETAAIQKMAKILATIDVISSLADRALKNNYKRPSVDSSDKIEIIDGRHPVIDNMLQEEVFVPNDVLLDNTNNQLIIITGPNMAGKSTYIRQVALITIMAQMGSYVPAKTASIGVADRIFTRVGAADDLTRGQSTFMVEMVETANILNNATNRSLIILDEIGRGTSTFDGLSLAWSIAEYLHDNNAKKARTLFATHYHELVELAMTMKGVKNYNVAVKEWDEKIIFLRKILPGGSDKSYGIHVARLAGLPKQVINRAKEILANLEGNKLNEVGEPKLSIKKYNSRKKQESSKQPCFDFFV